MADSLNSSSPPAQQHAAIRQAARSSPELAKRAAGSLSRHFRMQAAPLAVTSACSSRGSRGVPPSMAPRNSGNARPPNGGMPRRHLVDQRPNCEDVRPCVSRPPGQHFRSDVRHLGAAQLSVPQDRGTNRRQQFLDLADAPSRNHQPLAVVVGRHADVYAALPFLRSSILAQASAARKMTTMRP